MSSITALATYAAVLFSADWLDPGLRVHFVNHMSIASSGLKSLMEGLSKLIISESASIFSFIVVLRSDLMSFIWEKLLSHAVLVAGIVSIRSKRLSIWEYSVANCRFTCCHVSTSKSFANVSNTALLSSGHSAFTPSLSLIKMPNCSSKLLIMSSPKLCNSFILM